MSNETNYTFPFWPTLGGETYPLPFALFDKHGQWMLTIPYVMAHAEPTRSQHAEMVTGPWEFKFVVP
ncbi:MAG: hypothetical protein H0X37_02495 [Herpetosiphonaceae bacterium]|nr:hypothetical protein [Herpetosiphonaceae bacterium]